MQSLLLKAALSGAGNEGRLCVGVVSLVASGTPRQLLQAFLAEHADVELEIVEGSPRDQVAAVRALRMDVSFVVGTTPAPGCEVELLWSEAVNVVLPDNHRLANLETVQWEHISEERFIVSKTDPGPEVHNFVVRSLSTFGHRPIVGRHPVRREELMAMVGLGRGISVVGAADSAVVYPGQEEFATCSRVCCDCLKLRRQRDTRTRKIQTVFGTITVDAPRISICPCKNYWGFVDMSQSPLTELLPDRCTPELRRLQAELSVRHSYREAARLLTTLLPCRPMNHATMRNRTHCVAADLEQMPADQPAPEAERPAEMMVLIDGAHIRAAHGYQSRYVDVTVGKIEVARKTPRRFALAPKGAGSALATVRQAL